MKTNDQVVYMTKLKTKPNPRREQAHGNLAYLQNKTAL
jgi:hypothetical protein